VAVGIQGTVRDITNRKRSPEPLQTRSWRFPAGEAAEREHISRELHDQIAEALKTVGFNLQSIKSSPQTAGYAPELDESIELVAEALARIQELSLRPGPSLLDDLGLAAALRAYVVGYNERSGVATEVTGEADVGPIPRDSETACLRIAEEALSNVSRHARATNATVYLAKRNGQLHLSVSDNGIGFDTRQLLNGASASKALGLHAMFEQALAVKGKLKITSVPGKGTLVFVNLPIG
jgi:two-component system sensor histidine kinase UhpB